MISSCRCLLLAKDLLSISFLRHMGTKVKVVGQLDERVNQALEDKQIKPRHHPGKIKNNIHEFPKRLQKAMQIVLKDQPVQVLYNEGAALSRYLKARHAPISPEEMRLRGPKAYKWKPVEYDRRICLQYLVARASLEYAVLHRVFSEFTTRLPHFTPQTLFDFGSGVGTIPWAAQIAWGTSLKEIFCVDASSDMNDLAELLLRGGQPNGEFPVQGTFFRQFLPASHDRQYDIVASAYSLFEMSSMESRLNTLHNLWSKTKHYLVIIEQGTNAGFKLIDEAREFILYLSKTNEPAHVFAPCPHESVCPRLQAQDGTPCNFEIGYMPVPSLNSVMQKEKFCYVILGKGSRPSEMPAWPRVVRPVLSRPRHVICRTCTSSGNLKEVIFTASKNDKASYRCAKASQWGDLLPFDITEVTEESTTKADAIKMKKIKRQLESSTDNSEIDK